MSGKVRTNAEEREYEAWFDAEVEAGWARNGKPPEPINLRAQPRPSIIGTRPRKR